MKKIVKKKSLVLSAMAVIIVLGLALILIGCEDPPGGGNGGGSDFMFGSTGVYWGNNITTPSTTSGIKTDVKRVGNDISLRDVALRIVQIDGVGDDPRPDWGYRIYFGVLPQKEVSEELMV